jgi:predicted homoserine dehydrogenase-like protein
MLDGEGGYTVWGKLLPAERSAAEGALPIGLAHRVQLLRNVVAGELVRWTDVTIPDSEAAQARHEMERRFLPKQAEAVAAQ